MTPVQRFLRPSYSDGLQTPRKSIFGNTLPSAREISALVHESQNVENPGITHLLMQWGQFLDHDMTSSSQSRGFNGSVPRCCKDGGKDFVSKEFMVGWVCVHMFLTVGFSLFFWEIPSSFVAFSTQNASPSQFHLQIRSTAPKAWGAWTSFVRLQPRGMTALWAGGSSWTRCQPTLTALLCMLAQQGNRTSSDYSGTVSCF